MAFVQSEDLIYMKCTDALDAAGYVLELVSAGTVQKASSGAIPFGVAAKSTKDPISGTAQANQYVAILRRGVVNVKLSSSNSAINIGNYVGTAGNGLVDKVTIDTSSVSNFYNSLKKIVGIALESKAANSGGTIKVLLTLGEL